MAAPDDVRGQVLALVRRHGWNTTVFQTLEAGYSYLIHGDTCVAYVDTGGAWVAAGAPIAPSHELADAAARFLDAAQTAGKRACFFAAEERLLSAAGVTLRALRIGEQPVWDPRAWPDVLARHRSLREQLRRARAKGVEVRALQARELEHDDVRDAVLRLADRWLETRRLAPMGFLVQVDPLTFPDLRRCFVAELGGELVGFAGVVPVPARDGWFVEDLLRDPKAPNGTVELLVDAVMRWVAAEGSAWLTLGLAPLAGEVSGLLRLARRGGAVFYDFQGLRAYKAKLRPNAWVPVYLAFPATQGAAVSLVDALAAFTHDGFLRFGLRSLSRAPGTTLLLRVLTALLIPWTVLLASSPVEPWFGHAAVKWGWVAFDLLLAAGLLHLAWRPGRRLTTVLCLAVSSDALLTVLQAALWNLPQAHRPFEYAVIALACAGPALAVLVLWRVRRLGAGTADRATSSVARPS